MPHLTLNNASPTKHGQIGPESVHWLRNLATFGHTGFFFLFFCFSSLDTPVLAWLLFQVVGDFKFCHCFRYRELPSKCGARGYAVGRFTALTYHHSANLFLFRKPGLSRVLTLSSFGSCIYMRLLLRHRVPSVQSSPCGAQSSRFFCLFFNARSVKPAELALYPHWCRASSLVFALLVIILFLIQGVLLLGLLHVYIRLSACLPGPD